MKSVNSLQVNAFALFFVKIFVEATKMREESMDHVLLSGPPGLGKTHLAISMGLNAIEKG